MGRPAATDGKIGLIADSTPRRLWLSTTRSSIVFATLIAFPYLHAQSPARTIESLSEATQTIAANADPSVVQILSRSYDTSHDENGATARLRQTGGSGAIVDPAGYVITNAHVVGSAQAVEVLLPQSRASGLIARRVSATVLGVDRETDIAVLKLPAGEYPCFHFGDSDLLRQGQLVFAIGSPFGLSNSLSMGVVSSASRELQTDSPMAYVQTDAAINPGNSGGPLLNGKGELVGINTFITSASGGGSNGVGFAVPANIARSAYEQIRKQGRVRRGEIGVIAQTITPLMVQALGLAQESGAIIADVASRSAAEAAGLQAGDIVFGINGKPVASARQLGLEIYAHVGETVPLDVLRGDRKLSVSVAILERPRDADRLLSLVTRPTSVIARLNVLAVELDERSMPLLPNIRKLRGVAIAASVEAVSGHESGLQPGDVVYAVNRTTVGNLQELKSALEAFTHGETVILYIERAGQLQYLSVTLD